METTADWQALTVFAVKQAAFYLILFALRVGERLMSEPIIVCCGEALVDMLPPEQREVVILRHYADMSFKEIAERSNVSINTSLGRMRYALINMRKMIEKHDIKLTK